MMKKMRRGEEKVGMGEKKRRKITSVGVEGGCVEKQKAGHRFRGRSTLTYMHNLIR